MIELNRLRDAFGALSDRAPRFFRAPGRVNLIGEHVDYSEGFVLPLAIDRETVVAAAPRDDRRVRGADLALCSSVPIGAGLSSSAAFELAVGTALLALAGAELSPHELARAAREAENGFVGVRSGIMDQLAAALGVRDHALLIDCRSEEATAVPIPAGAAVVVADSGVRRALAGSAYNERRAESEEAARRLGVRALRDVSVADVAQRGTELPEPLRRRARHVAGENARTRSAAEALRRGDLRAAGAEMNASHDSLRDDYEASIPELDLLVEAARRTSGVYGARLTGGGFGGSVVVLVHGEAVGALARALESAYEARYARRPAVIEVRASDGAGPV